MQRQRRLPGKPAPGVGGRTPDARPRRGLTPRPRRRRVAEWPHTLRLVDHDFTTAGDASLNECDPLAVVGSNDWGSGASASGRARCSTPSRADTATPRREPCLASLAIAVCRCRAWQITNSPIFTAPVSGTEGPCPWQTCTASGIPPSPPPWVSDMGGRVNDHWRRPRRATADRHRRFT